MAISICIPIYNFDVTTLIESLSSQIKQSGIIAEIILIDDDSSQEFKKINEEVCSRENYIQLEKNIGRARIRNLFLSYANYNALLFLDCDSLVVSNDFLIKYITNLQQYDFEVICGGRVYEENIPSRSNRLRWKYGVKKESQTAEMRSKHPNSSFMTNNFLIKKEVFEKIKFDERITQYGHEDTLFGYELNREKITIKHIENPILNGDIETNWEYLKKTEKGLENLVNILPFTNYDQKFIESVTILNFYKKIDTLKMTIIVHFLFMCFGKTIRNLLNKGFADLFLFDFYKIGMLMRYHKNLFGTINLGLMNKGHL